MKHYSFRSLLALLVFMFATTACEDLLETEPTDAQSPSTITTIGDAKVVVNGLYAKLQSNGSYNSDMITLSDVRSDDMQATMAGRLELEYTYDYEFNTMDESVWQMPYEIIKNANNILEFIDDIPAEKESEVIARDDIKAQALAIRALCHFDLVKNFGKPYTHDNGASLGVPVMLETTSPYAKPKRNTVAEVYDAVVNDLDAAMALFSDEDKPSRMTIWGAKALASRVYLYMGDYDKAYDYAVDVIENGGYSIIPREDYVNAWSLEFTSESIFTLVNTPEDNGSLESVGYLSDPRGYGQFAASIDFINRMESTPDDIRYELLFEDELGHPRGRVMKYPGIGNTRDLVESNWEDDAVLLTNPTYVNNIDIFRLSELCLTAAESAVELGNQAGAQKYLNMLIVERLSEDDAVTGTVSLSRVLDERRVELVAEGHRFFDLVRRKKNIVRTQDGDRAWNDNMPFTITYDDYRIIYPIPEDELTVNPMTQNPGYQTAS